MNTMSALGGQKARDIDVRSKRLQSPSRPILLKAGADAFSGTLARAKNDENQGKNTPFVRKLRVPHPTVNFRTKGVFRRSGVFAL